MVYVWEFEFFNSHGVVDAVPCGSLGGGGTFGSDLNEAVASAADFLSCLVDDHLMSGAELPAPDFGHQPQHSGKIIAVAVSRKLADIPAVAATDAARMLGVSPARVSQLISAGLLDSWEGDAEIMVSRASVQARLADPPKTERQKPTLRDCIYGLAVGDALGVPYEFRPRGSFECTDMTGYGTHGQPAGTWSDDTSMTLATCDSIRELGCIDTEDMRDKFVSWITNDEYTIDGVFDYGGTTARALRCGKGGSGERDNGNGSLMRIAPLAFTDATDEEICEVSAITHAHRTSTESCVTFIELLRSAMNGALPEWALQLKGIPVQDIKSGGFVRDTLKAATWCFVNTDSYEDCVLAAVNLGDDTDTTAAVAGALAGTAYGIDAIPREWVDILRGKELIESCLF